MTKNAEIDRLLCWQAAATGTHRSQRRELCTTCALAFNLTCFETINKRGINGRVERAGKMRLPCGKAKKMESYLLD